MADGVDLGIPGIGPATLLNRGGSANVYLAEQLDFGRKVAVKVLFNAVENDATFARFDRECRAIGAVSSHPNIVVVHGRGLTTDERPYLVMEHHPGGSLADVLARRGRLTEAETVAIGIKIGRALDIAHRAGVLHRDIKPANILLSAYDEPALADFGIARIDGGIKTTQGSFSASVVHASREVLDAGEPTVRSDVYGLGSTLFELVVGRPAFANREDGSVWAVINRVLSEEPPDPADLGVDRGLAAVIHRSMSHDPETRQASAAALVAELDALDQRRPGNPSPVADVTTRHDLPPVPANAAATRQDQVPPVDLRGSAGQPGQTGRFAPTAIGRRGLAAAAAVIAAGTVGIAGFAYLQTGDPTGSTQAADGTSEDRDDGPGADRSDGTDPDDPGDGRLEATIGSGTDGSTATDAGAGTPLAVTLTLGQADIGPLDSRDRYALSVGGAPAGAEYRIVVDDAAVTERQPSVPVYFPTAGRHRVQVEVTAGDRTALTNTVDVYVSDGGPAPGFRANLASARSIPAEWPDALAEFDRLVADGHERLELSLSTREDEGALPFWNYYVDGFGDDRQAAQAYCDGFGLDTDDCFVAAATTFAGLLPDVGSDRDDPEREA